MLRRYGMKQTSNPGLTTFFDKFLDKEPLFINKKVMQSNYMPEMILHREKQVQQLANIFAPILRSDKPSNIFIYGKTGTGKTLCTLYTLNQLKEYSVQKKVSFKYIYVNCKLKKVTDTEYRLIAELAKELGKEVPITGLPTQEIYNIFINALEEKNQVVVLVLDEIDSLVKKTGDEILYNITRLNSHLKNSQVSFVGISNDTRFMEDIDPRVKSSLGEEDLIFAPYDAVELKDILEKRAKVAFKESAIASGVLEKCAAYAAREHGDARRALDLLRVAGEVAERSNSEKVNEEHIDKAEEKIEEHRVVEIVSTQPKQSQVVLGSILRITDNGKKIETGEVYEKYKEICSKIGLAPLTQRRVSDLIGELDMLGLINARVVSKGRYGRTREIYTTIPEDLLGKIGLKLDEELF